MEDVDREYWEGLLADTVRERENYNGMHQRAVMEIDRLRKVLEQAEIALDLAGLLLGNYLPFSSFTAVDEASAAARAVLNADRG